MVGGPRENAPNWLAGVLTDTAILPLESFSGSSIVQMVCLERSGHATLHPTPTNAALHQVRLTAEMIQYGSTADLRSITFSEHGCWWSLDVVCLDVVCPPPSCPAGPAARAARRSSPPAKARGEASRGAAAAGVVQARAARPRAQESFRERSKAPPILKGYDLFIHWVVMVTLASPRPSAFAVTLISPALGFPAPALPGRTIAVALPR